MTHPAVAARRAEAELSVEQAAARLGLPPAMLVRRIEAGDVPARRSPRPGGVTYHLRLSDLGLGSAEPQVADDEGPADQQVVQLNGHRIERPRGTGVDDAVPPPARALEMAIVDSVGGGPRADLTGMSSIDPRDLVGGLLDRWERTLEQRIYAEQRMRFEGELNRREAELKQLQGELETARALHALAQADKDRVLAEKERELADQERALVEARRKRRGWFSR
ncbi:MAG: OmpH family outer membrane protein [Candidatus Dormibacteria bacterium]